MMVTYAGYSSHKGQIDTRLFDIDLVKQDLWNHLNIQRGEVRGVPRFGTRIYNMIGAPMNEETKRIIEQDVMEVINYDPRVELKKLEISGDSYSIVIRARLLFVEFGVEDLFEYFIESNRL